MTVPIDTGPIDTGPTATPTRPLTRSPLSPGRRVALTIGGVAGATLIAWGGYTVLGLLAGETAAREHRVLSVERPSLTVELSSGDVTIRRGTGPDVVLDRTISYGLRQPRIEERSDADGVLIKADCPGFAGFLCEVSYEIAVPDGLTVQLVSTSGSQTVRDINTAGLRLQMSSGDAVLHGVSGPLEVRTSSGSVRAERLRSETVDVQVSSGDIELGFAAAPRRVDVEASSGDVEVGLPDDRYRVITDTRSGEKRVDIAVDPAADRTVELRTSSGDVQVTRASGGV